MLLAALPAWAQQAKGEPVDIGVGYFPSWNGGWSGTVIKKKELWKKYLPAGSTVRWEVMLVGFPVFNAHARRTGFRSATSAMRRP